MAVDVMIGEKYKVSLDFWTSTKGAKREFLTMRQFYLNRDGKWLPNPKNGVHFSVEEWNQIIPKLREMIYYKESLPGAPPFESEKEGETFKDQKRPPGSDDF